MGRRLAAFVLALAIAGSVLWVLGWAALYLLVKFIVDGFCSQMRLVGRDFGAAGVGRETVKDSVTESLGPVVLSRDPHLLDDRLGDHQQAWGQLDGAILRPSCDLRCRWPALSCFLCFPNATRS